MTYVVRCNGCGVLGKSKKAIPTQLRGWCVVRMTPKSELDFCKKCATRILELLETLRTEKQVEQNFES